MSSRRFAAEVTSFLADLTKKVEWVGGGGGFPLKVIQERKLLRIHWRKLVEPRYSCSNLPVSMWGTRVSIYQSGINEKTIVTCSVRNVSSNHNIHIGENLPFKQYYAPVYTLYKSKRCVFTHPGTDTELSFNVFIAHVDRHCFPHLAAQTSPLLPLVNQTVS